LIKININKTRKQKKTYDTVDSKVVAIFISNSRSPILLKELLQDLYKMIQLEQTIGLKVQSQSTIALEVNESKQRKYTTNSF